MAYRTQADADDLLAYEQAREAEGWASLAGYTDSNGNQFESFDDACRYYGADTPAQVAAEDAYWAEEEARELALAEANDALIFSPAAAAFALEAARRFAAPVTPVFWDTGLDVDDECPF